MARKRITVAALENAEAVPADDVRVGAPDATQSAHVAGAAIGLGAAEADRRVLDGEAEAQIVRAEVEAMREAADAYDAVGQPDRATEARAAADTLTEVVHSMLGTTWG